jgi:polar amino acid transport system substrate-binding protein
MVLLLILSPMVAASEETIHITTENWPPSNYQDENGKIVGHATEKVHTVFKRAGVPYTINIYPWARAYHLAVTQANTAVYTILRTPRREAQFQWVCPLQKSAKMHFYRLTSRKDVVMTSIKAAKKYKTSVSRNEYGHQFLKNNGFVESINIDVSSGDMVNVKKLFNRRVDLIIESEYSINSLLKKANRSPKEVTQLLPLDTAPESPNCLAFGLKTPKIIVDKIRTALAQVIAEDKKLN